jgi:6-phosphogluconate dehydrogenase
MTEKAFAMVGLGKMGGSLALQAMEKGWNVVGLTAGTPNPELLRRGLSLAHMCCEFRQVLKPPRVVLLYIPAGKAVDDLLDELSQDLEPGDIIADGGNSYWGDSIQRAVRMKERGFYFVDLGTSGGVSGARHGACFMAGGEDKPVHEMENLLRDLAVPGGFVHAGPSGAGHFAKLVHNGIEFGMLQAIGEGLGLLEAWPEAKLELEPLLECWGHGSVIRSWLIELIAEGLKAKGGLESVPDFIEDTGEVNWLVSDACHMEVPIPVIAQSVMQLFASRDQNKTWAKAVSLMRHGFGGHPFGPSKPIAEERHTGRLSDAFLSH